MMNPASRVARLLVLLAVAALPLRAESMGLMELISVLEENGTITQEQAESLLNAASPETAAGANENRSPLLDASPRPDVAVGTEGDLSMASYDGRFSAKLGGRLHLDAAYYEEDKNQLGDGTRVRKAWIELDGTFFQDWGYELDLAFEEENEIDIKDAALTYKGFWPSEVIVGHFKEPFSLEEQTSANDITFMERALVNELVPQRSIGVGFRRHGANWNVAAGLFGEDWNDDPGKERDEGWGTTARAVLAPVLTERRLLHLGAGASYRVPDEKEEVDFKTEPESSVTQLDYLDTDDIDDVQEMNTYGLEAAATLGPVTLQSEYVELEVFRNNGEEDLRFAGWYVSGGWILTGEHREYDIDRGAFDGVTPRRGMGALELAARYSTLDLNEADITGGEQSNITIGLNWYPNTNLRMMLNYILVDGDEDADADGDVDGDDDPRIVQLRVQVDF